MAGCPQPRAASQPAPAPPAAQPAGAAAGRFHQPAGLSRAASKLAAPAVAAARATAGAEGAAGPRGRGHDLCQRQLRRLAVGLPQPGLGLPGHGRPPGEIARLLYPQAGDLTILKPRHSAFYASPLELLLAEMQARELVICGLATDMCVQLTAMDAFLREFRSGCRRLHGGESTAPRRSLAYMAGPEVRHRCRDRGPRKARKAHA